jgi:hypothetical protein
MSEWGAPRSLKGSSERRECLALNGIAKSWNRIAIPTN